MGCAVLCTRLLSWIRPWLFSHLQGVLRCHISVLMCSFNDTIGRTFRPSASNGGKISKKWSGGDVEGIGYQLVLDTAPLLACRDWNEPRKNPNLNSAHVEYNSRKVAIRPHPNLKRIWDSVKPNSQCTYKVTWRRVRAIIVAVEKKWVLHIPSVCL